jgi:hypothetical protein
VLKVSNYQRRIATLGLWNSWFSYYLHCTLQGSILNGAFFRPLEIKRNPAIIEKEIDYFKPQIIFTHAIFQQDNEYILDLFNMLEIVRKRWNIKVVLQEGDPKFEPRFKEKINRIVDLALINNQFTEKFSTIWGIPCIYWPYFCMVQDSILEQNKYALADVAFSGNVSENRTENHVHYGRKEFLDKIGKQFNVRIYPDNKIGNSRFYTPEVAASSKVVLGIHQGHNITGYLDTRPFQYIGAGALYFHDKAEIMEKIFKPGFHYVQYNRFDVKSFYDEYNYFVNKNPEEGNKIRQQGFEYCQKYHSSKVRIKFIIDVLEGKVNPSEQQLYWKNILGE